MHVNSTNSRSTVNIQVSGFISRDAPNMLKTLPIIPSRTSQNLSLVFFKIPPIVPTDSKKIIAIAITQLYN